jgi:glycerol-3-phosphate acyltransferase PlsY
VDVVFIVIALIVGYLLGTIPFGLLLTKLAGTGDIRSVGSGNIGATNVLRTGHKGLAAGTLIGDLLKGTVAVLLMHRLGGTNAGLVATFSRSGSGSRAARVLRPISAC